MALWSGVGGGNFASSMSNISPFFPKRLQGTALGINAGLGNFGVTTMQILIPLVMTVSVFGALGGDSMTLVKDSGWILGKFTAGTESFIQNAGFTGFVLGPPGFICRFGMNITAGLAVAANPVSLHQVTWLYTLAFIPAIGGLYLYLPAPTGLGLLNMWVAMPLIIIATLLILKLAAFGPMKENISKQFAIFKNRHTWSMTALYLVTFGSLSGFPWLCRYRSRDLRRYTHPRCRQQYLEHSKKSQVRRLR